MMQRPFEQLLHWTPRVLGLLFAVFVSVFALDVFGEGYTFWKTLQALAIHLIPTAIILATLAISWRSGWMGALVFFSLAVWYIASTWGRLHWSAPVVIAGPLFLLGLLFAIDWCYTVWGPFAPRSEPSAAVPDSARGPQ
jgi:hypothetical protein